MSGLVEVHLDNLNNPGIGSFAIANTGRLAGQNFVNVNWFTFSP